jgi:hypothetical protein
MVELAAARTEIEAAAVAELKALRASSTGRHVFADDDRDNELKLAREAAREQVVQWVAAHPRGAVVVALTGATSMPSTVAAAQTGADASAAGLTEIAAFTGAAAPPPRLVPW